jgi:hypothetical protein
VLIGAPVHASIGNLKCRLMPLNALWALRPVDPGNPVTLFDLINPMSPLNALRERERRKLTSRSPKYRVIKDAVIRFLHPEFLVGSKRLPVLFFHVEPQATNIFLLPRPAQHFPV